MKRSAAPAIAAIAALVVAWDAIMPRCGYETICATWRRWGRQKPYLRLVLAVGPDLLAHHLSDGG